MESQLTTHNRRVETEVLARQGLRLPNHVELSANSGHLLSAVGINRASTLGKEVRASWSRVRRGGSGSGRVCELHR
jgi:hypothetical protein